MTTLSPAQFQDQCDRQLKDLLDRGLKHEFPVVMDKVTALDEWGESVDEACQMCGKPVDLFPTTCMSITDSVLTVADTRLFTITHPDTGTRFEWTTCPTCSKKLRLSGVREEATA